ncbi:hypothetical protein LNP74_28720 [Klebsiella pneumoniae subsp. pneumoniae]|nr:hypothetical protein [Klebsiella pneumoniae subsp. pneumoniae]
MQDSTGLAVRLEQRCVQRLRAPHKIKMAVSGCTRECAEARWERYRGDCHRQSGWNPGTSAATAGWKPRHADLFAQLISTKRR